MSKRRSEQFGPRVTLARQEVSARKTLAADGRKTKGMQTMSDEPRSAQSATAKRDRKIMDFDPEVLARELEPKMDAALLLIRALDAAGRVTEEDLKTRVSI